MLDAFKLLAKPSFAVFMICSLLICIPLAYYFANTSGFLYNMGFEQPASAMTIGQMSEIFFMLLVPFFFRKLGVKWMILVGMLAWVLRYVLFSLGAPEQVVWMLFAGLALHGICYDFFFVTGFMYTDKTAPKEIRGQAQSMLVFFTQGVGMFIGYKIADYQIRPVKGLSGELTAAIGSDRAAETLTFSEQLANMFAVKMPASIHTELLTKTSELWKAYWLLPAGMAAAIAVIFFIAFRDRSVNAREEE
jgi:MFS family permease